MNRKYTLNGCQNMFVFARPGAALRYIEIPFVPTRFAPNKEDCRMMGAYRGCEIPQLFPGRQEKQTALGDGVALPPAPGGVTAVVPPVNAS